MTIACRFLVVGILLVGASFSSAQEKNFEDFTPFALGKVAGQVDWMARNCGGRVTTRGTMAFSRSRSQDPGEFDRGYKEGAALPLGYVAMVGVRNGCKAYEFVYGPSGLSGLWEQSTSGHDTGLRRHANVELRKALGIVTWAMLHRGVTATSEFLVTVEMARQKNPKAFAREFNKGYEDGYDSERTNGRQNTCITARMLYGPGGLNVPDLIE